MKFKEFLKKWVINNIGYKILAIVFAFVLWVVILNITDPEITRTITNIPVNIENEDAVLDGSQIYEITSGEVTSISVSGSRSIVGSLTAEDFVATADFSELSITNAVPITVELTGDMARYSNQVEITVRTTSMIISLDDITTLSVPVEVEYTGVLESDMVIDSTTVTPSSVTITAPQSVLNTIESVVATVDYADVDGDTSLRVTPVIYDADGNEVNLGSYGSVDYSSVLVAVEDSFTKTVSISMDDPTGVVADGYTFTEITYSIDSVTVKGSEDLISSLDNIDIPVSLLDITGAAGNVSVTVDISDYLPEGVSIYSSVSRVVVTAHITQDEEETTTDETDETTDDTNEDETN